MERLLADITAFAGTNLDDLLVLTVLFSRAASAREKRRIVIGQYLGIFLLLFLGMGGAWGLSAMPAPLPGLLGLVPVAIGIRGLLQGEGEEQRTGGSLGMVSVAMITLSNGADNLGVYIPLFTGYSARDFLVLALVFGVMTGLWCLTGMRVSRVPVIERILRGMGPRLVPAVMIGLGVFILFSHAAAFA